MKRYIVRMGKGLDTLFHPVCLEFEADDEQGIIDLVDQALRNGYQALVFEKKE